MHSYIIKAIDNNTLIKKASEQMLLAVLINS